MKKKEAPVPVYPISAFTEIDLKKDSEKMNEFSVKVINNDEKKDVAKKKMSIKQKVALVMLAMVDFTSFCSMSIMAPFYPKEAAQKGVSESMAGFVFSFYALIMFISSPYFGKVLPKFGVKNMFVSGVVMSGLCSIIFGLLQYINDYTAFTTLSFVVRGLEALGASVYSTAAYVIIIDLFPDHIGAVRGILETFVGLGLSAGPAIGGFLFEVGGFGLPFYVMGFLTIIIAPLNLCLLPNKQGGTVDKKMGSIKKACKIPAVLIVCLIIVVVSITWSFLDPTLEPHLRQFNLGPKGIGLVFLLLSGFYGTFSPIWGWVADKMSNKWLLMPVGLFFSGISLLFVGPSSAMSFIKPSACQNIIALAILGIFVAMSLMPTFQGLIDEAIAGGLPDSIGTQGVVAGLWSCVYSLGEVLGPALGGLFLEHYGFPVTSFFMAIINIATCIISTIFFLTRKNNSSPQTTKPEIENNNQNLHNNTPNVTSQINSTINPEVELKSLVPKALEI